MRRGSGGGCGSRWWVRAWRAWPRRGSWSAGGHEVVVVEKSRGLGGRLASRRVGGHRARPRQPGGRGAARIRPARADRRPRRPPTGSTSPTASVHPSGRHAPAEADGRGPRRAPGRAPGRAARRTRAASSWATSRATPTASSTRSSSPRRPRRRPTCSSAAPRPATRVAALRDAGLRSGRDGPARAARRRMPRWPVRRPAGRAGRPRCAARRSRGARRSTGVEARRGPDGPRGSARDLLDASDEDVLARALPALGRRARAAAAAARPGSRSSAGATPCRAGAWTTRWSTRPGSRIVVAGDTLTGATLRRPDHHRVYDERRRGRPPRGRRCWRWRRDRRRAAARGAAAGAVAAARLVGRRAARRPRLRHRLHRRPPAGPDGLAAPLGGRGHRGPRRQRGRASARSSPAPGAAGRAPAWPGRWSRRSPPGPGWRCWTASTPTAARAAGRALVTDRRVFAQEVAMHALFGLLLGLMVPGEAAAGARYQRSGTRATPVGALRITRSRA